jgi:hypothetical protein
MRLLGVNLRWRIASSEVDDASSSEGSADSPSEGGIIFLWSGQNMPIAEGISSKLQEWNEDCWLQEKQDMRNITRGNSQSWHLDW